MTEVTKESVGLKWEEPESNGGMEILHYIIEKKDAMKTSWSPVATVNGRTLTQTATKLTEGNEYYFRVSAENQIGVGPAAELESPIKAKLPYGNWITIEGTI